MGKSKFTENGKPLWVFVSGIYRSGSTTQYEMVRDIVEKMGLGVGIGYHTEEKLKEYDNSENQIIVCKVFEPLFIGFQEKPSYAQKFFEEGRVKAFATIRDPRDVITSMKKRAEGRTKEDKDAWSFEETAKVNFPVWFKRLDDWLEWGALETRYEDMILNLFAECKRIANHLDIVVDDDTLKSIAKNYTVAAIQKRKQQGKGKLPSRPGIVFGTSGTNKTWLSGPERRMVENSVDWFIEKYNY